MRVSIAMCTYNGAQYLEEQLTTIGRQELLPDELIICDDGSSDDTVRIAETFASRSPFKTSIQINPVNLGYSRNFAKAVSLCTGDVIALSDQDDIWYPRKLSRIAHIFETNSSVEGVFTDGDIVDDSSNPVGRALWESFRFASGDQARFRSGQAVDALLRRNVVTGMAFAFRSSVKSMLSDAPKSWVHDGWMAMLLALRSTLYALPEKLVGYRVHTTQSVGTPLSFKGKLDWIQQHGLRAYVQLVHDKNLDEYQRTAIQFEDLVSYLAERHLADEITRKKLLTKVNHARRCAQALSLERLDRWQLLLPHLVDYAHLSPNGLRALPRDLFI